MQTRKSARQKAPAEEKNPGGQRNTDRSMSATRSNTAASASATPATPATPAATRSNAAVAAATVAAAATAGPAGSMINFNEIIVPTLEAALKAQELVEFAKPVTEFGYGQPLLDEYAQKISRPMDIRTLLVGLAMNKYKGVRGVTAFFTDAQRISRNCKTFNQDNRAAWQRYAPVVKSWDAYVYQMQSDWNHAIFIARRRAQASQQAAAEAASAAARRAIQHSAAAVARIGVLVAQRGERIGQRLEASAQAFYDMGVEASASGSNKRPRDDDDSDDDEDFCEFSHEVTREERDRVGRASAVLLD